MGVMQRPAKGQAMVEYMLWMVVLLLALVYGVTNFFMPNAERRHRQADAVMGKASDHLGTSFGVTTK